MGVTPSFLGRAESVYGEEIHNDPDWKQGGYVGGRAAERDLRTRERQVWAEDFGSPKIVDFHIVDFEVYPKYENRLPWDHVEIDYFETLIRVPRLARVQCRASKPKIVY